MDKVKLGLLTTLLLGIFILIGAILAFLVKKKEKVVDFSLGLALGVITMLIVTDLSPEIIENLGGKVSGSVSAKTTCLIKNISLYL